VPYAIEAWPEGDQRHLAAESGLYCRVITEGLFGIKVIGFNKFLCQPFLPKGWQKMSLKHIRALQDNFDISVERKNKQYTIVIRQDKGDVQQLNWDGINPITVELK
jgi:cellobiose phosphorylase